MLIHEVVNVISLEEIFLVELRAAAGLNQRVFPAIGGHRHTTLKVVVRDCRTFSAIAILSRHESFFTFHNDLVHIFIIGMISISAPRKDLCGHVFRVIAFRLKNTRSCDGFHYLGRILKHKEAVGS